MLHERVVPPQTHPVHNPPLMSLLIVFIIRVILKYIRGIVCQRMPARVCLCPPWQSRRRMPGRSLQDGAARVEIRLPVVRCSTGVGCRERVDERLRAEGEGVVDGVAGAGPGWRRQPRYGKASYWWRSTCH